MDGGQAESDQNADEIAHGLVLHGKRWPDILVHIHVVILDTLAGAQFSGAADK
jgi:hypothetical protein